MEATTNFHHNIIRVIVAIVYCKIAETLESTPSHSLAPRAAAQAPIEKNTKRPRHEC